MELYYSQPHPERMVVMTPALHDYRLSQERHNGSRMDNTLDFADSRTFKRQRKWMQTSTGGLSGANSPFSDDHRMNSDFLQSSTSPPHQWEFVSTTRHYPSIVKQKKSRTNEVPGQPKEVIKNGYYKEFVAASLLYKRVSEVVHEERMMDHVDRASVNSKHGSARKKIRKEVEDGEFNMSTVSAFSRGPVCKKLQKEMKDGEFNMSTVSAFSRGPVCKKLQKEMKDGELNMSAVSAFSPSYRRKEKPPISTLRNRLKSLPPPPPLVKVVKAQLKNRQSDPQEILKTGRDPDTRGDANIERIGNSSQERLRRRDFENSAFSQDFEAVQSKRNKRESEGSWEIHANQRREETFYADESVHSSRINTGSRSFSNRNSETVSAAQFQGYPIMTARDGTVYVTMNPVYDVNCTALTNNQSTYRHSRTREQLSSRFQELSRGSNNQFSPRPNVLQNTLKQDIETPSLRNNEMRRGFAEANNIDAHDGRLTQDLSNGDVIIIQDSPPHGLSHDMTSQIKRHPPSFYMQQNGQYYMQEQNQSSKQTLKCYCQSHVTGQRCPKTDLKRPPPLRMTKNTPPPLSPLSRSSSSSSLPSTLASSRPPHLLASSVPQTSSSLLVTLSTPSSSASSSSSSPKKSATTLSPKTPHGSFPNQSVYSSHVDSLPSTPNIPGNVSNDAFSNRQYSQTPPSGLDSSVQCSPSGTKYLYQTVSSRLAPLLPKPSPTKDRNKNDLPVSISSQKLQRRMTYPLASQGNDVHSKATLKRVHSDGDKGSGDSIPLSSEMLLQIPIEGDKEDAGKSYGGFAYDHDSLPIIVAVHSIAADVPPTAQKHNECNKKCEVDSGDLSKQKSLEEPTYCLTAKDDSKVILGNNDDSCQNDINDQPPSQNEDKHANTAQDMNIASTKISFAKRTEEDRQSPSNQATAEKESKNIPNADGSGVSTNEEKISPTTATENSGEPKDISDTFAADDTICQSESNNSPKPPREETSVARLSKKILETRKKINNEKIDWKKKLLCKLESILIKRLRKAEVTTGVKATIDIKTPKEKQAKTNQKTDKKQHEGVELKGNDSNQETTKEKKRIKKQRKLKKVVTNLAITEDEQISDCELTIAQEETQDSRDEENSTESINSLVKNTDNTDNSPSL